MIRFRRFEGVLAIFEIAGESTRLTKKDTLALHNKNKHICGAKGTCPDAEQTKFALDRWPDTALAERIRKLKK
jgi:hypothetical protein